MKLLILILSFGIIESGYSQSPWRIVEQNDKKQIDILLDGKLMTSYCYYDSVMKPVLFPINTVSGITVTRGYPIAPRAGDHVDHPHHTGLWLNYEFVNGLDFWNNSTAIAPKDRAHYGTILHDKVLSATTTRREAQLEVSSNWLAKDGTVLLKERTSYVFRRSGTQFMIDRITTLAAMENDVSFKDVKDGFLGLRVASELEMPSKGPLEFIDSHGKITKVDSANAAATGMYVSSEGLTGDAVWGTRGRWCMLYGRKGGENISISIIDHPANVGYPTYWHARGYGLFAANPLGQEVFSKGKEKLNFDLKAHQSVTFRFRIVIASGAQSTSGQLNALADEFASIK